MNFRVEKWEFENYFNYCNMWDVERHTYTSKEIIIFKYKIVSYPWNQSSSNEDIAGYASTWIILKWVHFLSVLWKKNFLFQKFITGSVKKYTLILLKILHFLSNSTSFRLQASSSSFYVNASKVTFNMDPFAKRTWKIALPLVIGDGKSF